MRKKQLEMILQKLEGFSKPKAQNEQYVTPAPLAAELLHLAYIRGELKSVVDLGCGTGVLSIGAALLGAKSIGVDIDGDALAVARHNARSVGVNVDFIKCDVNSLALSNIETVVMNPPFGAQFASQGDRAFLKKAVEIGHLIYSIHNAGSRKFIEAYVKPCRVEEVYKTELSIPRSFKFHTHDVKRIEVELYRIVCR